VETEKIELNFQEESMKIKALVLASLICISAGTKAHAFGLGAQFNFSAGGLFAPGAALLISPGDKTHMAINWYLDLDKVNIIGLTLDVCPLRLPLSTFKAGTFNFTLGVGLFANLMFADDRTFNGGLRIPVGLNLLVGKNILELFTHVAPSFGLHFLPSLKLSDPFFPIAIGARLWFR